MSNTATQRLTLRLTPEQKARIERLAHQKGTSTEDAVLSAVDRALAEVTSNADDDADAAIEPEPGSFLEAAGDLVGSIDDPDVPSDLSTNPKYMEDYGKD